MCDTCYKDDRNANQKAAAQPALRNSVAAEKSAIETEQQIQEELLVLLDATIERLYDKLQPIMPSVPEETDNDSQTERGYIGSSQVYEKIRGSSNAISRKISVLSYITSRIEL